MRWNKGNRSKKHKYRCTECGSDQIQFDCYGVMEWDVEKQEFITNYTELSDNGEDYCINCDTYMVAEEVPIKKLKLSNI